jgi:hypothetical protein
MYEVQIGSLKKKNLNFVSSSITFEHNFEGVEQAKQVLD